MVFRGGGELASAAARLLHLCGFEVVVLERASPWAVRRRVAFASAVIEGRVEVEGVGGRLVSLEEVEACVSAGAGVPVLVDEAGASLPGLRPDVLVDGRMAKQAQDTRRAQARLVVGLGPGFSVGEHVHAAIETQRGSDLGRVLWDGAAQADTGVPAPVLGVTDARVLRAPRAGRFRARVEIGARVEPGETVGEVEGEPVVAGTRGLVRGLLADGVAVPAGVKLGDVDPRGQAVDAARLSDKARAVAAGVLEAVLVGLGRRS